MKFDHQAFQVSDIGRSNDFYVNKPGFRLRSNILEFIQLVHRK